MTTMPDMSEDIAPQSIDILEDGRLSGSCMRERVPPFRVWRVLAERPPLEEFSGREF